MMVPPAQSFHQYGITFRNFLAYLRQPKVARMILEGCVLLTLIVTVVGERALIASQRRIMPAGDVFNFQSIARHIPNFSYPIQEKRLPGFPLAILLGTTLGFDATQTGIALSIIASAGTTIVLYLLGRHFGWPILPLALCLMLTAVAPLLVVNGVRPLADSYFMFFIVLSVYLTTVARPTWRWALAVGLVLMWMVFTRYEGGPTAVILLLLLRFRMSWKLVGIAALPLLIAGLLWIPVAIHVHGSLSEFGYTKDAQQNASIATLPADYMRLVAGAGFGRAWMISDMFSDDEQLQKEAKEQFHSLGWWLSALATFGLIWLVVALPKQAAPVVITFFLYPVLPAWWFTYSRYAAPISAFYFFAMAAGAVGVWTIVKWFFKKSNVVLRFGIEGVLVVLLMMAVLEVAPIFHREAMGRSLENNGKGYALYQVVKSLQTGRERVAVSADYLMAYMALGSVDSEPDGLNAGRGLYLSNKPEASTEELAEYIKTKKIDRLIDAGEKEVVPLVTYLHKHGVITKTDTFEWPLRDGSMDTASIHHLAW